MRTSEPPGWNRVTKWHAGSASMRMRHQHECESSRLTASSALGSGGMRLGIDAGFLDTTHACCAVPGCLCDDSDLDPPRVVGASARIENSDLVLPHLPAGCDLDRPRASESAMAPRGLSRPGSATSARPSGLATRPMRRLIPGPRTVRSFKARGAAKQTSLAQPRASDPTDAGPGEVPRGGFEPPTP